MTRRVLVLVAILLAGAAQAAEPLPLEALSRPGRVLMLRHAYAPGTGDPANFRIGDCSTQRNLDSRGRAQAAALGAHLRKAGIAPARVYSSEWCRCLETARLLDLGPVEPLPALNSFFDRPQERDGRIAALRAFLSGLPPDGAPVVLVTHQVTITAITGRYMASGAGVILELDGAGAARLLGAVDAK